jgi:regulator of chromosome condensation
MASRKRRHENIETATEEEKESIPTLKKRKTTLGATAAKTTVSTPEWAALGGVEARLLACGSGEMAQLGMGEDKLEAPRPAPVLNLDAVSVIQVAAGGGANGVLVAVPGGKKEVWTWGCNDHGVLGRLTKVENEQSTPAVIPSLLDVDVVQISLGDYHMMCLDSKGQVWSWGTYRDANGILGFKPGNDKQMTPQLLSELKDKRIISIASGDNTSYALSDSGHLYMWGDARINQRTSSRSDSKLSGLLPAAVPCSKKFTAIFAGGFHVMLLATDGTLWAMGLNNHEQLGTGGGEIASLPKHVKGLPAKLKIKMATAGQHHSMLLAEDGSVYTWGRGDYGQLGHNAKQSCASPTRVAFFDSLKHKVVQVSCGGSHSLAVLENGDVYSWGFGTMYQLGIGKVDNGDEDRLIPTQLNNEDSRSKLYKKKVIWAAGGGQHSVFAVTPGN